eukprot:CAMPEP_0119405894 /NCGR_PEP_ID=MMETSP1335-20130426/428_1 /TAXON_ID=259385 /ORGANISM="Chrysoculter rhomboideus, Strain RCC1486" /LENGTH=125 /DNA_ID=CAMNT_0007429941 /DNA_START=75 /DNA_END=452 /DNA_ORIENTATION=-
MASIVSEIISQFRSVHRSLRLMSHWNPEHIPQNAIYSSFRGVSPGSQATANVPSMAPERYYDIAYYCRDKARSRTSAYPETLGSLSNRHRLTKDRPKNASAEAPAHLNRQGVGSKLGVVLRALDK